MTQVDPHTLRVLEWETLTARIAACAVTPWGAERLRALKPVADFRAYEEALAEAAELLDLLALGETLPLRPVERLEPLLDQAAVVGAHLDGSQFLRIADFYALVGELARFGKRCNEAAVRLRERLTALEPADDFQQTVFAAFEPDGTVKDSASPRLKELRRKIGKLHSVILDKLQKTAADLGSESVVTMREGRYVVSVTEHDRSKVRGIVHDRSQSGTTYFVEPMPLLELGNDLRSAQADERNELIRLLTEFTTRLQELVPAARRSLVLIAEIDSGWGRAVWAWRHGGRIPTLAETPDLDLRDARHPLLLAQSLDAARSLEEAQRSVIPLSLTLSDSQRAVIISGPNTGGKTVGLKSVGLIVLMVQAGVPPLVGPESTVGCFDAVFADIGDEQSLALSLSTFSAHLKQVGHACRNATSASLILLDELGVGTDPEEGVALARAVIAALVERGSKVLVTTHYSALKIQSEKDARVTNAAFLFDETKLQPTYQLVVGRPGASYALEIARRLDFPPAIIGTAEQGVGRQAKELAGLLARLAEQELKLQEERRELEAQRSRLAALEEFNKGEQEKWERLQKTAQDEARREARGIVDEVRRETERVVAAIRTSNADPRRVKEAHQTFARVRPGLKPDRGPGSQPLAELVPGRRVRLPELGKEGEVVKVLKDGERVQVQIGNVHYTVDVSAVELSESEERTTPAPRPQRIPLPSPESATYEVDLRGRAVDEAQLELEDIFEAAETQGWSEVRVIHGRGTGLLRRGLTSWFRQHARISSFRTGGRGEGGDGVTVVKLKKS